MLPRDLDRNKLTELIRARREERSVTVGELSEALGWSRRTTQYVLSGHRRASHSKMLELLDYLSISEDEIPRLIERPVRPAGNHVFISYCHRDKEFLARLMVHLRPLEKQGLIDAWVDTQMKAGDKWKQEIKSGLEKARVAVLLISADFLASDFIVDNELPPLLHSAEEKGTLIIPVILKPCRFLRERTLCEFQAINSPEEPLSLVNEDERELVYDTVAQQIEDVMDAGG